MVLSTPQFTTKLFPKLHSTCAPSHPYSKNKLVLHTRTSIIITHKNYIRFPLQMVNVTPENGIQGSVIILDDAVVKRPKETYRGKKWKDLDLVTVGAVLGMHLLCGFAPFTFTWEALKVAVGLDLMIRLLGVNFSYHRHLSHRSFKIPKWLEYTFAYCGVQSLQGNPIDWVRIHRYHHQYCDTERDPHTPIKGFWFSHMTWMFDTENITKNMREGPNNVKDLEKQSFYRFMRRTYIAHPIALALLLYTFGGLPFIVWGMGVRTVWGYHITWLVNSVCHGWGDQAWNTQDVSLNNRWVGIIGFGDGWHNNHHAFSYSARHGLEWWQIDVTWYLIRFLEIIGVASNVKLPTPSDIQRRTITNRTL
ncbi:palmitoyl-monogalactosyldiacylglycerol delta-7 desaturase, chloroplastic-like [Rutidosis leptorrhynchoides]|uniref:palmitoyl-monogalactosyldiacylglycerol delta-7 desaturase, chloroplastic-like n=1 Tax=Rutidosis leptorrhynchoides TaxID=125765 RepID=UPI003A99F829